MQIDLEEIWYNLWHDKRGNIVIWQTPNAFLIAWAVLTIISLFVNGKTADVFSWAGLAALIVWSLIELFKGVNYFRRLLGLSVLILGIMSLVKVL